MFRLISLMSLMVMTAVLGIGITMYAIQNAGDGAIGSHLKAPERVDKPGVTVQAPVNTGCEHKKGLDHG